VLGAGVVFAAVLWWQLTAPRFFISTYWSAVVMVSVFWHDVRRRLARGFWRALRSVGPVVQRGARVIFVSWSRVEHTLSIHSTPRPTELFYWPRSPSRSPSHCGRRLQRLHGGLGFLRSGLIFAIIFCLPIVGSSPSFERRGDVLDGLHPHAAARGLLR